MIIKNWIIKLYIIIMNYKQELMLFVNIHGCYLCHVNYKYCVNNMKGNNSICIFQMHHVLMKY